MKRDGCELEWQRKGKWRSTEEHREEEMAFPIKRYGASRLYFCKIRTIPTGDAI